MDTAAAPSEKSTGFVFDPNSIPFSTDTRSRQQRRIMREKMRRRQDAVPIGERSLWWWMGVAIFVVFAIALSALFSRLGWGKKIVEKLESLGFRRVR